MNRRTALSTLAAFASICWTGEAFGAIEIAVIVNKKNPTKSLELGELAAIFTTRRTQWKGGENIVPFNAPPKTPLRVAFDKHVLDMDPDEVARYWIDRRVRGGRRPPRQIPDSRLMVRVVATLEGAIGYVHASEVDDSVRVLQTFVVKAPEDDE